ncbi:hypothetical protein HMPREF0321_2101 [Dermacoccus sp. Ellin185]|nr:hypothetical protein HMPREF0321_2101 [Dermacoccus sp. Ellin185]
MGGARKALPSGPAQSVVAAAGSLACVEASESNIENRTKLASP